MADKALLTVKNLSVDFAVPGKTVHAVKDVSFAIPQGKTLAVVGESGSGKSVTALSLLRLLPYPVASHPSGSIKYDDLDIMQLSEREMRSIRGNRISMIFQEPMTALNPLHTIEKQIGEVLFLHKRMSKPQADARIKELLDLVGLPMLKDRLKAYPHELSGGQRQRVMIAMALANEPDLLIADEPTTALDVTVQAQILDLLKDLQAKLGMSILLITHDLSVVKKIANRVVVMRNGEVVEQGAVSRVFKNPEHPYTQALINATPSGKPLVTNNHAPVILTGEDIRVHFPGKKNFWGTPQSFVKAVDGVNLAVRQGQTLGIVGESGSGKTTLGMALLQLIPSKGLTVFQGRHLGTFSPAELKHARQHLQVVFQDPFGSLSPRMTVGDIIAEGLKVHRPGLTKAEVEGRVIDVLNAVSLEVEARHRYPHEFSGGQRQRISIARALILEPKLIILDEPTSALDVSVQAQIVDLLRTLQDRHGIAYIFISHDLRVVKALSHHVLVMKDGKVVEQGSGEKIFATPEQDYTKNLIEAAFG